MVNLRTRAIHQEQAWDADGFYAWTYERPTSVWFYALSALMVVAVIAVCLFPLAPYRVKVRPSQICS